MKFAPGVSHRWGGQDLAKKVSPFGVLISLMNHGMTVGIVLWAASSVGACEGILSMISGRHERLIGRKRVCDASIGPRKPSGRDGCGVKIATIPVISISAARANC